MESLSRKAHFAIVAILCGLAAILIIVGVTYSMQIWGGKSVPDVIGMEAQQAEDTLSEAGFASTRVLVKSDLAEGTVIASDPSAGDRADEGSQITLEIASSRIVPNIIGMPVDDAKGALSEEGLDDIAIVEVKSNEPGGTVLSVDPPAGSSANANTRIMLDVAVSHRVPKVDGMSENDATSALKEEGYEVQIEKVYAEDAPEGSAVATDPEADSELPAGSTVLLKIAKHREGELVDLTRNWLKESSNVKLDNTNYEISEIKDVKYKGDNTVEYSVVARPYESLSWLGIDTRYGNYQTVHGTITWNDSNEIASSNPRIERI